MSAAVAAEKENRSEDVEDGLPSPLPPLTRHDSGISPKSQAPDTSSAAGQQPEYFPENDARTPTGSDMLPPTTPTGVTADAQKVDRPRIRIKGQEAALREEQPLSRQSSTRSTATITRPKIEIPQDKQNPLRPSFDSGIAGGGPAGRGRTASISSLSFAALHDPKLPQGKHKKTDKVRIRASSPPPKR